MASLLPTAVSLPARPARCARLVRSAGLLSLPLLSGCLLCSCGVRIGDGGAGPSSEGPEQGSAANQPAALADAPNPEAGLAAGPQRGFALAGSVAYDLTDISFLQCGFRELWSLRFEGLAFERFQELALGEECDLGGCFFALAGSGDLSARGRFGQARDYPRELTATRLTRLERVRRAADLISLNLLSCAP